MNGRHVGLEMSYMLMMVVAGRRRADGWHEHVAIGFAGRRRIATKLWVISVRCLFGCWRCVDGRAMCRIWIGQHHIVYISALCFRFYNRSALFNPQPSLSTAARKGPSSSL